jgi:hypothetical protein
VNETSWARVWRLRFRYLGTGHDTAGQSSAQEEVVITDATVPDQNIHQLGEAMEDTQHDSKEEIEAFVEDELVHLRQENELLQLEQEQMIRQRIVMKRAQIMQQ